MNLELNLAIYAEIQNHCSNGDDLLERGNIEDAILAYDQAWQLTPDPRNQWEASTWILAAIADASFKGGYLTSAREALHYAMTCPGAIGNPFLHLRRGQVLLDQGDDDAAADELMRAYMAAGEEIFVECAVLGFSPHARKFITLIALGSDDDRQPRISPCPVRQLDRATRRCRSGTTYRTRRLHRNRSRA